MNLLDLQSCVGSKLALKKNCFVKRSSFFQSDKLFQIFFVFRELVLPVDLVDGDDKGTGAALVGRQELGQALSAI